MYTYPEPEVAAAMEASVAFQVRIMSSIIGIMSFCWVALGVFFLYYFCKPLRKVDSESDIELRVTSGEREKKWWIDDCDVV